MSGKKKTKLPKWFNGVVYNTGEEVVNPFSGQSYKLNAEELSMYDFIMGAQMMFNRGFNDKSILNDYNKGLRWFSKTNIEAYMVLLD